MASLNQDYPVIDGIAPSWSDVIIRITPKDAPLIDVKQIKSIKRTRTVTLGEQVGASGGRVIKRTTGAVKLELSAVFYRDGWNEMLEKLALLALTRGNQSALTLVHFGVQVQHTPPGSSRIFEWRAKGVRILGDAHDHSEGTDADTVDVPMSVIDIVDMVNGREVVML